MKRNGNQSEKETTEKSCLFVGWINGSDQSTAEVDAPETERQ